MPVHRLCADLHGNPPRRRLLLECLSAKAYRQRLPIREFRYEGQRPEGQWDDNFWRLKRDGPDLAERVVSGELTAYAATLLAGFQPHHP
jgi:hypothetical protein